MTIAQDRMDQQAENALFAGLNPEQRQAVETTEGPLLVLAGAGTGKTRVLTTRIVHILQQNLAFPSQILAVTFTNKAAGEMRERVEHLVGGEAQGLWLGTFHSLCVRILRQHVERLGFNKDFTILNTDDQLRLLKQLLVERNIDEKRWPAKVLGALLDRLKDRGWTPEAVPAHEVAEFAGGKLLSLYEEYQRRLKTLSAMDFGDLLLHTLTLFKQEKDVLEEYQRRFRYILVDEYQDTNVAQYLWLRLLAQGHQNLCCVGDDDQSIYGWRGAEVGNILKFEKDFPGATVIRLERNYRSTADILGTASHLIAFNKDRLGKTLWTEHETSEKVRVVSLWDEKAEAAYIADEIEAGQRMGRHSLDEVAILVRAGFQTRAFEECFLERGIPYKVVGGLRFYERMEVRDAIAYLRLIQQPDDDLAFERIINTPRRGIGKSTLDQIRSSAREQGISCMRATEAMLQAGAFGPKIRSALSIFTQYMAQWRTVVGVITPAELAERVLDESGYLALWKKDKSIEAEGRVENLNELLHALEEFDTLSGFLEHISLVMDADEAAASGMATISTLHAAKGLEFSSVFLPGWEEGLMPHQRSLDEKGKKGLEEERRLAYVGITRARRRLNICFAANRRVYNQWQSNLPSRFIDELPGEHIEILNRGTGYGNKAGQGFGGAKKERGFGDRPLPSFTPAGAGRNAGKSGVVTPKATGVRRTGARVFHQKFGYGQVIGVQGEHLTIRFDKAGTKTVIAEYVEEV